MKVLKIFVLAVPFWVSASVMGQSISTYETQCLANLQCETNFKICLGRLPTDVNQAGMIPCKREQEACADRQVKACRGEKLSLPPRRTNEKPFRPPVVRTDDSANISKAPISRRVSSGGRDSGSKRAWSEWYSLCSGALPSNFEIQTHEFHLEGDRSCGSWSHCEMTEQTTKRICYRFQMQGREKDDGFFGLSGDGGVRQSTGVLSYTANYVDPDLSLRKVKIINSCPVQATVKIFWVYHGNSYKETYIIPSNKSSYLKFGDKLVAVGNDFDWWAQVNLPETGLANFHRKPDEAPAIARFYYTNLQDEQVETAYRVFKFQFSTDDAVINLGCDVVN